MVIDGYYFYFSNLLFLQDHIDTITNSHKTFLDKFDDLGTTLDDVHSLIKRHENFMATLLAQDERLVILKDMAEKLIGAKHFASDRIQTRWNHVTQRRQLVKDKAWARKQDLVLALNFQKFKADADEFVSWCMDKNKAALDENYKDLSNLERKIKKQDAFTAELMANEMRLASINKEGEILLSGEHFAKEEIKNILDKANSHWEELCCRTQERSKGLKQAQSQANYLQALQMATAKLDEIEKAIQQPVKTSSRKECKDLIKKCAALETELNTIGLKINELVEFGHEMAASHFDGINIVKSAKQVSERYEHLKEPLSRRKALLAESLKLHEFDFEVDAEIAWIREHEPAQGQAGQDAISTSNLTDAQNLLKKHEQCLEREVTGSTLR